MVPDLDVFLPEISTNRPPSNTFILRGRKTGIRFQNIQSPFVQLVLIFLVPFFLHYTVRFIKRFRLPESHSFRPFHIRRPSSIVPFDCQIRSKLKPCMKFRSLYNNIHNVFSRSINIRPCYIGKQDPQNFSMYGNSFDSVTCEFST